MYVSIPAPCHKELTVTSLEECFRVVCVSHPTGRPFGMVVREPLVSCSVRGVWTSRAGHEAFVGFGSKKWGVSKGPIMGAIPVSWKLFHGSVQGPCGQGLHFHADSRKYTENSNEFQDLGVRTNGPFDRSGHREQTCTRSSQGTQTSRGQEVKPTVVHIE